MVRFKQRYIVTEFITEKPGKLSFRDHNVLKNAIKNSLHELYGDYGLAVVQSNFYVKYLNEHTRTALIRVARGAHSIVVAALTALTHLDAGATPLVCRTLHVAGSIRQCQKFLVRHNQQRLRVLQREAATDAEREELARALDGAGVSDKAQFIR